LGFLHCVQGEFLDNVLGTIIVKFTSHTLQKTQNQKLIFIPRWKSKIKINDYKEDSNFRSKVYGINAGIGNVMVWAPHSCYPFKYAQG
jgi:hypothetical protein